jgi:outer membrane protein
MKKALGICFVVFCVMVFWVASVSAQTLKIGVYDIGRIMKESKTVEGYNKELTKNAEAKIASVTAKEKALQQQVEKLKKQGTTLSEANRKALEEKIVEDDKELKRLKEDAESELRKVQAEMRQKILADIMGTVRSIGEKEKYDIILEGNTAGITFLNKALDITDKVLNQMK